MPSPEQIAAVTAMAVSASYVAAFLVQFLKDAFIDPRMPDTPARTALLRGLSYFFNLALLIGALLVSHQFDPQLLLLYATVALGQFGLSHAGYSELSGGANPKGSAGASGVVRNPSDTSADTSGGSNTIIEGPRSS